MFLGIRERVENKQFYEPCCTLVYLVREYLEAIFQKIGGPGFQRLQIFEFHRKINPTPRPPAKIPTIES